MSKELTLELNKNNNTSSLVLSDHCNAFCAYCCSLQIWRSPLKKPHWHIFALPSIQPWADLVEKNATHGLRHECFISTKFREFHRVVLQQKLTICSRPYTCICTYMYISAQPPAFTLQNTLEITENYWNIQISYDYMHSFTYIEMTQNIWRFNT